MWTLGWRNIFPSSLSKGQTACHVLLEEFTLHLCSPLVWYFKEGTIVSQAPFLVILKITLRGRGNEQTHPHAGCYRLVACSKLPHSTEIAPHLQKGCNSNHLVVHGQAQDG